MIAYIYVYYRERAQKAFRGNIALKVGDLNVSNSPSPKLSALGDLLRASSYVDHLEPAPSRPQDISLEVGWVAHPDTLHLPICSLLPCTLKRGMGFSAFLFTCSLKHRGGSSLLGDDRSLAVASTPPASQMFPLVHLRPSAPSSRVLLLKSHHQSLILHPTEPPLLSVQFSRSVFLSLEVQYTDPSPISHSIALAHLNSLASPCSFHGPLVQSLS